MNFQEILQKLIYGRKVRRQSWREGLWIESNGETVRLYLMEKEGKRLIDVDTQFSLDDVMAEDWELF